MRYSFKMYWIWNIFYNFFFSFSFLLKSFWGRSSTKFILGHFTSIFKTRPWVDSTECFVRIKRNLLYGLWELKNLPSLYVSCELFTYSFNMIFLSLACVEFDSGIFKYPFLLGVQMRDHPEVVTQILEVSLYRMLFFDVLCPKNSSCYKQTLLDS